MTTSELTKKIYKEFPKVWEKLKEKYDEIEVNIEEDHFGTCNYYFYGEEYDKTEVYLICIQCIENEKVEIIPFPMLYGLLDDFFEENNIYLEIVRIYTEYDRYLGYDYWIVGEKKERRTTPSTKHEAKQNGILKACEILEERLKRWQIMDDFIER